MTRNYKKLSSRRRRANGFKAPKGLALSYALSLRELFNRFQTRALDIIVSDWERNTVAFGFSNRADSRFTFRKLAAVKLQVEQVFKEHELDANAQKFAKRVEKRGQTEFRKVIGISSKELGVKQQLSIFRKENVALIKSLARNQILEIETLLTEGEEEAWRVEELRAKIRERFDVTKSKADLLARDQVLKLNGRLTKMRHSEVGIKKYIWTTANDERVRESHQELDGTECEWDNPPIISDDGRTGHPGEDYQCRCTPFPILEELDIGLEEESE